MSHSTESINTGGLEGQHREDVPKCRNCGEVLSRENAVNPEVHEGCCGEDCAKQLLNNDEANYSILVPEERYKEAFSQLCEKFTLKEAELKSIIETFNGSSAPYIEEILVLMKERDYTAEQLRKEMDSLNTDNVEDVRKMLEDFDKRKGKEAA